MEITYDTGAKVILQGPVTYEVESARGGYMSVGKLTAEWRGGGKRSGDKRPNQAPGPTYPFVVRTPTATVTDLGTEFGVEVDAAGVTRSHVFQGKVIFVVISDGKPQGRESGSARMSRPA